VPAMNERVEDDSEHLGAAQRAARPELTTELAVLGSEELLAALRTIATVPAVDDVEIGPLLVAPAPLDEDGPRGWTER